MDGIHISALSVGVFVGIQVFDNECDTTKRRNSLVDIHLTRLLAMHSKHYITTVVANGRVYCQTQELHVHSLTACLTLPITVRTRLSLDIQNEKHSDPSSLVYGNMSLEGLGQY